MTTQPCAIPAIVGDHPPEHLEEPRRVFARGVQEGERDLRVAAPLRWLERVVDRRRNALLFHPVDLKHDAPAVAAGFNTIELAEQERRGRSLRVHGLDRAAVTLGDLQE